MGRKSWKVNEIKSLDSRRSSYETVFREMDEGKKSARTIMYAFKYYFLRKHKSFKLGRKMDSCWRKRCLESPWVWDDGQEREDKETGLRQRAPLTGCSHIHLRLRPELG